MNSEALTKSAFNRVVRGLLQLVAGYVTVEVITEWIAGLNLDSDVKTLLVGVATLVYTFVHRRFLDPSRVPSMVDGEAAAGTEYEGQRVAGDGKGLT